MKNDPKEAVGLSFQIPRLRIDIRMSEDSVYDAELIKAEYEYMKACKRGNNRGTFIVLWAIFCMALFLMLNMR
ncbi:hypothetical protein LCGC14_0823240 [marine sediment metagenome]|uniref:Uncharacterized protein n=1 Tax=marine sediment metagenome TaxID=412755 RepID=A0A0F9PI38_9ZZZZ